MDHHEPNINMMPTSPIETSSLSNAASENSSYENVVHKKVDGSLLLTSEVVAFQPSASGADSISTITISWSSVVKHQVSPASHPKALLKIVLSADATASNGGNGKISNSTFQFQERTELERIRKDISNRLQQYRRRIANGSTPVNSAAATSSASLASSGKKRSLSDMQGSSDNSQLPPTTNSIIGCGRTTTTSFGELDSTALAVTRSSLLAANPSLRAQHHYLVEETQTISEDDFWATHQDLLEEEYARISGMARPGTSSLLQSHLQLLTGRVTLGVEEMRQIFIMYPAVHKAYEEKVPLELSDEQFWRKYLESEYFHRDRGRIGAASRNSQKSSSSGDQSKANKDGKGNPHTVEEQEARAAAVGTDDLFSRYDQKIREKSNEQDAAGGLSSSSGSGRRKWGTELAVGQFDLASTFETERGNLLEGPKDNHPPNTNGLSEDEKGARVIQKYNRHWAMVLHPEEAVAGSNLLEVARKSVKEVLSDDEDAKPCGGADSDMKQLVSFAGASSADANHALGKGMAEYDDYEELTLTNVEAYYSGRPSSNDTAVTKESEEATRKRNGFFATSMVSKMKKLSSDVRRQEAEASAQGRSSALLEDSFPQPKMGKELLTALTKKMAQDSKTDADALEVVKTLPEHFKKRLHAYFRRSSELLRHFFGLRKLLDTQPQQQGSNSNSHNQKLKRIVQGMETVYREMEGIRKEIEQTETGEIMRKMCLQIMDQLDWAFKLHREGSGGGGGGGFVTIEEF